MINDSNKDKEQRIFWNKWVLNNYKGTWIASTGVGKTRAGVLPIGTFTVKNLNERSLIIVSRERLRDHEWPNEFINWGYEAILPNVEIECINTARNYKGRHYNTVVVDEVHLALSEENRKFFIYNTWDRIICLTAKIDDQEKLAFLSKYAPIVWQTSDERALDLGLVSPCVVYNFGVPLSKEEAKEYNIVDANFMRVSHLLGGTSVAFNTATKILSTPSASKEDKSLAASYFNAMTKRNSITNNSIYKPIITKAIIDMFPNRQALLFSESTEFANKIQSIIGDSCMTFHSKITKKQRENAMKLFESGELRVISSCKALNEGVNVPDCSLAICTAATSKSLTDIQRRGRIIRLKTGKLAIYINLYNIGTQEAKRLLKRTENQDVRWITSLNQINELE